MKIGITRRVVRIVWLLGIAVLACLGFTLVGIAVLTAASGGMPPLAALLVSIPLLWMSSMLAAYYFSHVGQPAWRPDGA